MVLRFEVGEGGEIWIDNLGKKMLKICSDTKFCRIRITECNRESSFYFL